MDPIVELKNVSGRIIKNASISIYPSEKVAILGPSGSGKTTLLRLINLLEEPASGEILYRGKPASDYNYPDLRRKIILLPQMPVVVDGTVMDNMIWAHSFSSPPAYSRNYTNCLNVVGIAHLADKPAEKISGGEKQRLNLAMAFSLRPELMLLDEPTSALDPNAAEGIHSVINRLRNKGVSFVMVTHSYREAVKISDRIGIILDGELKQYGPSAEVLANPSGDDVALFLESHRRKDD